MIAQQKNYSPDLEFIAIDGTQDDGFLPNF
jgi:hypothetical protein